jgi:hypothetical protein
MSTSYNDKPVLVFTDIVENETAIPTKPTAIPTKPTAITWFKRWLKWFGYRTLEE